jgi:two-component system cell cycle response regulator DivK
MREFSKNGKTVLVVEDSEDSRHMMRLLLETGGYNVIEASDGRQAVQAAEKECPDVILMDLSLPVIDGLSATRLIRRLHTMCDVPIIVVSAHDRDDFYDAALAAGCNEYLTKPVDYDLLEEIMRRLRPISSRRGPEAHSACLG